MLNSVVLLNPPKAFEDIKARQAMIFNKDPNVIVTCRLFDEKIKILLNQLSKVKLMAFEKNSLDNCFSELEQVNTSLDEIKCELRELYIKNTLNQKTLGWLSSEVPYVSFKNIGLEQANKQWNDRRFRWRLGHHNEKRAYADNSIFLYPDFVCFFEQESKANQILILEFERVRIQLVALSRVLKSRVSELAYAYPDCESLQNIRSIYHKVMS